MDRNNISINWGNFTHLGEIKEIKKRKTKRDSRKINLTTLLKDATKTTATGIGSVSFAFLATYLSWKLGEAVREAIPDPLFTENFIFQTGTSVLNSGLKEKLMVVCGMPTTYLTSLFFSYQTIENFRNFKKHFTEYSDYIYRNYFLASRAR